MRAALKLTVEIPEDHIIKLPDDVPVGKAEMIILLPADKTPQAQVPSQRQLNALAYFMRERTWAPPSGTPDSVEWLREDRAR